MTSSINVSRREPRNSFPSKSWDIIKIIIFLKSDFLLHAIIEVRTFSDFTESYQLIRKLSIWLNQLSVEISTLKNEKFIFFRSRYSLLYYAYAHVFLFFVFESHDREIDQQTNLPIDSEVTTVNFLWKHIVMHIIRKLLMYWTQKYNFYSKTMYKKKVITFFSFWWWKWLFFTVTCKSGHVIYYFKGNNVLIANIVVLINQFSLGTIQTRK